MNNNKIIEEFIERGAELEHMRWARWQKYLHSKCQVGQYGVVIPRELYDRWERQIEIPYDELSEPEKESDRKETRNYLPLVESLLLSQRQEIVKILEGMKKETPDNPIEQWAEREKMGWNSAISEAISIITKEQ